MHFINHLGKNGAAFLHPGGRKSTHYLIEEIRKLNPRSALEIGCGTGATLVGLASKKITGLVGIDISQSQIEMARRRIAHCNLEHQIQLELAENSGRLNFDNHVFDVVYAESVLGILSQAQLVKTLQEVKRVLKPNGVFITNDAIWKREVNLKTAKKINQKTMQHFGLIQSNAQLIGTKQWENLFALQGFKVLQKVNINTLPNAKGYANHNLENLSDNFSQKAKKAGYFKPIRLFNQLVYGIYLKLFHKHDRLHLENYLFILKSAQKPQANL